ncbi:MAG: AAA family ATPase [Candidatus Omnitrophota bacterium]
MKIADYVIWEKLSEGKKFTVYRALHETDNQLYILKILDKKKNRDLKLANSLNQEFHYLQRIDSDYVIKAFDRIEDKDYTAVVLEDIHGKSLKEYLKENRGPFEPAVFMPLALRIANGLAAIYRQNIIHKDINPTNIIWNSQTGDLKIIDFNIASTFDIRVSYLGNPEKLQGTLPYISPEQTGRMNRRTDHRTDFYSLGATFYELLTGKLPFGAGSPIETVYAHLARDPEFPHAVKGTIPPILSHIILKLMAKNPEQRYQSAVGLIHDLEKAAKCNFTDFPLGENDFPGKLQIPERLYGRENEIDQLLGIYREVCAGTKRMVLVAGYSGTGKTALVNEIHQSIAKTQGYFCSGKFDQLQRMVPYSAFIQALNQLCRLLLTEPEEILAQWKEHILHSLGKLGKILTDRIPLLESVIGKQPDVPEVGGDEAKKRFNYIFQCFLQAVCREEHPLVMFIDDLQWADLASLNLLQVLMEDKKNRYLLFIGAYRDNETSPLHPLMMTLDELQRQEIDIRTIPVRNLTPEDVCGWLLDILKNRSGSNLKEVSELSDLIYQKTQGNAFFTIQFLENLYRENWLRFDFATAQWTWNIRAIENQKITDNVVELLVHKIQTLPPEVQEVLKLAACIGNTFDLSILSVISKKEKNENETILEVALIHQLVSIFGDEDYKFVHDRVHQAAYTLIAEDDRKSLHLKIGQLLLGTFGKSDNLTLSKEAAQHIFDIVHHLNIGLDLLENEEEKIELARLNLNAGQIARESAAYKSGADYIQTAIRLLPADSWERLYALTLAVYNEAVQIYHLCGEFDVMENLIGEVLAHARDTIDTSIGYEYRVLSLLSQNQPLTAVETMLEIFKLFGVAIPRTPDASQTNHILTKTQALLEQNEKVSLRNLPMMTDPEKKLVLRLFYVGAVAFLLSANACWPFIIGTMTGLILEFGLIAETPYILACYGIIKVLMGDISGAYRLGEMAIDLLDRGIGNEAIKVRSVPLICFYIYGHKQHFKTVCKLMMESYPYALNVGDFEYAVYSLTNYTMCLSRTDTELGILNEKARANRDSAIQLQQLATLPPLLIEIASSENLLGQTPNPTGFDLEEMFRGMDAGTEILYRWQLNIKRILFLYLFEDYPSILGYLKSVEESLKLLTVPITYILSDCHFYIPLAYLQLYASGIGADDEKETYLKKARERIDKMKEWAEFGPVNFLHKYYLLCAEWNRVQGHKHEAAEYYDKAIETALENEYVNEAALANELAAKFYMHQNRRPLAAAYFLEARECYRKWGALAKVKHLEANYPAFLSMIHAAKLTSDSTVSSSSTDTMDEFLDIKSIIKASQTLSGEVSLKHLLEKMMGILIENAGAKKGVFIENMGERLLVQAEGDGDGVTGILQREPVEESNKVPLSAIHYVGRSSQVLALENATKDAVYSSDPYIQAHGTKSILCFPIIRKEKLSAIIYLENNLVEGAFTPSRIEVLNTLSAQIAISMENARIYRDLKELNESLEQKVRERTLQLEEMDKIKSRFFANISHEFRTPLTLIMGPLEQWLTGPLEGEAEQKKKIRLMLRNSQRLLGLINQLLELARFDSGKIKLQASCQNMIPFLRGILYSFDALATQNELELVFRTETENMDVYVDHQRLEEAISNLLSNAVKFTPAGGQITLEVRKEDHTALISVKDTGPGIPAEHLDYIFDRFYQADSTHEHHRKGSGIGLAIVKEVIGLHHGTIRVDSPREGGTDFQLRMPLGNSHLSAEEMVEQAPATIGDVSGTSFMIVENDEEETEITVEKGKDKNNKGKEKQQLILVIEDNADVRSYIRGSIDSLYTVIGARDGEEGVKQARERIPDLIISDIMMPGMDGYEVCKILKTDVATSHIPIILLTAKAQDENIIQGLETGADDYITKPFNTRMLTARIKNLIELRQGLQVRVKNQMVLQPSKIELSKIDTEFLNELQAAIEKNLSEFDFGVEELCQTLYMSHATLYRKINALTGETPTDFIRSYRLKRAAELLKKSKPGTIKDIAFGVGFSSTAYFTRCFKEKFNQLPSTYMSSDS